jgi:serine/threonine protein kinase
MMPQQISKILISSSCIFPSASPSLPRMTLCGTAEYMAPELMFDEENYSFEIDIFSFGMVLLEVLKRGKVGQGGFAERNPRTL